MPWGVSLLFTIAHSLYLYATLVDEITGKSRRQLRKIPEISGPSKKFDQFDWPSKPGVQRRDTVKCTSSLHLPRCVTVRVIKRR